MSYLVVFNTIVIFISVIAVFALGGDINLSEFLILILPGCVLTSICVYLTEKFSKKKYEVIFSGVLGLILWLVLTFAFFNYIVSASI